MRDIILAATVAALCAGRSAVSLRIPPVTRTITSVTTSTEEARLAKRKWVSVCPPNAQPTDCQQIGVDDVLTEPSGGHWIPVCDDHGNCHYVGYAEPTASLIGSTTYALTTETDGGVGVIPIIIPLPPGEPVPPPPLPPIDEPPPNEPITVEPPEKPTPDTPSPTEGPTTPAESTTQEQAAPTTSDSPPTTLAETTTQQQPPTTASASVCTLQTTSASLVLNTMWLSSAIQAYGDEVTWLLDDVIAATTTASAKPAITSTCESAFAPDGVTFKVSDADKAISDFCTTHSGGTPPTGANGFLGSYQNGDSKDTAIIISAQRLTDKSCHDETNVAVRETQSCISYISSIMNGCDTDTVDKKHGGAQRDTCIWYSIHGFNGPPAPAKPSPTPEPKPKQKVDAVCHMHIKQHASWSKGGDPTFNPRAALLFRIEATIYSSGAYLRDQVGYSASTDCGPDRPLKIQLDQEGGVLQIAPRGNPQNNDIDFALSTTGENWKMSDKNHCKVGAFDPGRGYFPADRQMDCTFNCPLYQ